MRALALAVQTRDAHVERRIATGPLNAWLADVKRGPGGERLVEGQRLRVGLRRRLVSRLPQPIALVERALARRRRGGRCIFSGEPVHPDHR